MADTRHDTGGDPGTPVYDAVLGDHLQAAALAVTQAGQDAADFRVALDRGQEHALEQLAVRHARELVGARTAHLAAQRDRRDREARLAGDLLAALAGWHTGDPRCRACGEAVPCTTTRVLAGAPVPTPAPIPEPAPPRPAGPTLESRAVEAVQARLVSAGTPAPTSIPSPSSAPDLALAPAPAGRPAASARDGGPAAPDVPSVPSMKDLFSSTRAAGWLDNLLGSQR